MCEDCPVEIDDDGPNYRHWLATVAPKYLPRREPLEAIVTALHNISNDEIKVRVLNAGVGAITESDVTLADASKAPIIGFNVRPNANAREPLSRFFGQRSPAALSTLARAVASPVRA